MVMPVAEGRGGGVDWACEEGATSDGAGPGAAACAGAAIGLCAANG